MTIKLIKNNLGISILEVIAAITIITMGMIGVMSLVIQNIEAQNINKNVLIASSLAQEGLELVRNVRDLNWLTDGNIWNQDIGVVVGDGTYTIDYGGRSSINRSIDEINDAGARLYIDDENFYSHTGFTDTNFYRLITVSAPVPPVPENHCDNGVCEPAFGERIESCTQDCYCGDGVCDESGEACPADCAVTCNDGANVCDPGETSTTCPADCPPPANFFLDVKCEILWKDGSNNHSYTAETYLYDWR